MTDELSIANSKGGLMMLHQQAETGTRAGGSSRESFAHGGSKNGKQPDFYGSLADNMMACAGGSVAKI
jgi:hypothetical protein